MDIVSINFDNIVPNHFLVDENNKSHPETTDCLEDFFAKEAIAVCLDFSSVTAGHRACIKNILIAASLYSKVHDQPFFVTPALAIYTQTYHFFHLMPDAILYWEENIECKWGGAIEEEFASALSFIITKKKGINEEELCKKYGCEIIEFIKKESDREGSFIRKDNGNFIPRLTLNDLKQFSQKDSIKKIKKSLLDTQSIRTCSHFKISKSKLHTDTIFAIERALGNSTNAFNKLLDILLESIGKSAYSFIACSKLLESVADSISNKFSLPVIIVDLENETIDSQGFFGLPPVGSHGIVIEPICRSGETIEKIANIIETNNFKIESSYNFFSKDESIFLKSMGIYSNSLVTLEIQEFSNKDKCPLCMLEIDPIVINSFNIGNFFDNNDMPSFATPHHFWPDALKTGSVHGMGDNHIQDKAEHDYLDYIEVAKLLGDVTICDRISSFLYMQILNKLNSQNIPRQKIRYIVYKKGDGAKKLAESLIDKFDGWVKEIELTPYLVEQMQLGPDKWPNELVVLQKMLRGKLVILVDDGVNRGWTIRRCQSYFRQCRIPLAATAVVVNRMSSGTTNALLPMVEYYRMQTPVWRKDVDCPKCAHYKFLNELINDPETPHCLLKCLQSTSNGLIPTNVSDL